MITTSLASKFLNIGEFERRASALSREFRTARPFPHVVIDGLIQITPEMAESFPTADWDGWKPLGDTYQLNKRACDDIERIPAPFSSLVSELSSPSFLRALETLTGIKRLLPDPYLAGGGLHLSGPGGILSPHTDFHHYRALDLYRRINVLAYFNDDWQEADGGCLTLYAGDDPVRTVVPTWGRIVVFQTDDRSVHGFPVPITEGKWRRSVALYYYTAAEADIFSGDATTYWREHRQQHGAVPRARMSLYRGLLHLSRAVSLLAHLANPNQGVGLVKTVLANKRKRQ